MPSPAVLLIGGLTHTNNEWKVLGRKYTLKEFREGTREQFRELLKAGEFEDVVGLYRSNQSTEVTGPFDQELINELPKSLRYICHNGAGYDNVDVPACSKRDILVSSTPIAVNNATADIAIFLLIGALRQIHIPITAIREGKWRGSTGLGHDPRDKTLGILGMGGIGQAVAARARAFRMKIIYHNRSRLSPEKENGASYVSLDELLAKSDILSLNLSLNENTRHIISAPQLAKMKDGAIIINTARGALIKEVDLVTAIESGKIASAGLDVFEKEPSVEPGLLKNPRVVLLPHIGTATYETQREMELLVLQNLESGVDHGTLVTPIPEQANMKKSADEKGSNL